MNMHAVTQQIVRHLQPQTIIKRLVEDLIAHVGDVDEAHDRQEEWVAVLQHGSRLMAHSSEAKCDAA